MRTPVRPARHEAATYYFTYIDQVPGDDVLLLLETQRDEILSFLAGIGEDGSRHRYADGKWSIRQVLGHVNDCERLFTYRAMWFARGFDTPLPSFDQSVAAEAAGSDGVDWAALVEEFRAVRAATLALFRSLPDEAWDRRGTASGSPVTVRALAFIAAGHATHHLRILRERYRPEARLTP